MLCVHWSGLDCNSCHRKTYFQIILLIRIFRATDEKNTVPENATQNPSPTTAAVPAVHSDAETEFHWIIQYGNKVQVNL